MRRTFRRLCKLFGRRERRSLPVALPLTPPLREVARAANLGVIIVLVVCPPRLLSPPPPALPQHQLGRHRALPSLERRRRGAWNGVWSAAVALAAVCGRWRWRG
jgi:hypothetical protein